MPGARAAFELKSLVGVTMVGYALTLLFGTIGYMLPENSYGQLLLFQLGDAAGITASVLAAGTRDYAASRSLHRLSFSWVSRTGSHWRVPASWH